MSETQYRAELDHAYDDGYKNAGKEIARLQRKNKNLIKVVDRLSTFVPDDMKRQVKE